MEENIFELTNEELCNIDSEYSEAERRGIELLAEGASLLLEDPESYADILLPEEIEEIKQMQNMVRERYEKEMKAKAELSKAAEKKQQQ